LLNEGVDWDKRRRTQSGLIAILSVATALTVLALLMMPAVARAGSARGELQVSCTVVRSSLPHPQASYSSIADPRISTTTTDTASTPTAATTTNDAQIGVRATVWIVKTINY
jgi:hypothetical protein